MDDGTGELDGDDEYECDEQAGDDAGRDPSDVAERFGLPGGGWRGWVAHDGCISTSRGH